MLVALGRERNTRRMKEQLHQEGQSIKLGMSIWAQTNNNNNNGNL